MTCDSNPDLENIDDRSTACAYKVILYIFFFAIDENEENDRLYIHRDTMKRVRFSVGVDFNHLES